MRALICAAARAVVALLVLVVIAGCPSGGSSSKKPTGTPGKPSASGVQYGIASWYGGKHHGGPTASGERFNKNAMTAAHRTLRMGTRVRVTRIKNGRVVIVRINDRGPYSKGRIIDLSEAAARDLDMIDDGIAKVKVEVLK